MMKKAFLILCLSFSFLGCKKEARETKETVSPKTIDVVENSNEKINNVEPTPEIDTLHFNFGEMSSKDSNEYALIHTLSKKYDKDSICDATFRVDFIQNKKLTYSHILQVRDFVNHSEWYGEIELDTINTSLKSLSIGYPACGYKRDNFLFYINKNSKGLVYKWESFVDLPVGSIGRVVGGKPESFIYRGENFDYDANSIEYLDSTLFSLKNNVWLISPKTSKGKVYRSGKMNEDKFHKSNDS